MRIPVVILAVVAVGYAFCDSAHAGSTFYYSNTAYKGLNNSPFQANGAADSGSFHLENFEDGLVNSFGLTVNRGLVQGNGFKTDSVDKDDGNNDGFGRQGHSFSAKNYQSIVFKFSANGAGNLP